MVINSIHLLFQVDVDEGSLQKVSGFSSSGSYRARRKVSFTTGVLFKAQMDKNPAPRSHDCWQK